MTQNVRTKSAFSLIKNAGSEGIGRVIEKLLSIQIIEAIVSLSATFL